MHQHSAMIKFAYNSFEESVVKGRANHSYVEEINWELCKVKTVRDLCTDKKTAPLQSINEFICKEFH